MTQHVLSYPDEHYLDNFTRKTSIMYEYHQNMLTYLRKQFPHMSDNELKEHIDQIIKERYTPRQLKYIHFESKCNARVREHPLLDITNQLNDHIFTPYGTTHVSTTIHKSVFSEYIEDNQAARKEVKKRMFLANARNDKELESIENRNQMNIKININVLSGVMCSSVTFRSAINYNTITAAARFNVMTAYAITELCMASNYYFTSETRAINWIINTLRIFPGTEQVKACIEKYMLRIPTAEHVYNAYIEQLHNYAPLSKGRHIKKFISALDTYERAFVYYAFNLKRIIQDNPIFVKFFDRMLNIEAVPLLEGEIPKISKLPDEFISTFTVVVLSDHIKSLPLVDIDESHPDLARRIYSTYIWLENELDRLTVLFNTFIMLPIVPSDVVNHKNMIRNTVLLSDTDSILFTNVQWVDWYLSDIKITDKSTRFNAAIVTIISKLLEHTFAYQSACMNIDKENLRLIAMKNEFMYDLFLRTPISKHYAGYARYREGVRQDPYKFDLKGKNFKGSDLCKETTSYVKWFIKYVFDSYLTTYELRPEDFISKVIIFEQRIKKSIDDGEVTFLMQKPVQMKNNYKKPESSNYLFYELWQAVFAEKYGDIHPPQKTKELPIEEICLQNTHRLNHMKTHYTETYEKLIQFMSKYPKRKFSRVLIPIGVSIPEELRTIADYRKVCAMNCYSIDLILKSLNIVNYPNSKNNIVLFSDTYPEILLEITDEQRETTLRKADQETYNDTEEDDDTDEFEDEFEDEWIDDDFGDED